MFWDQEATGPDLIDCSTQTAATPTVGREARHAEGQRPGAVGAVILPQSDLSLAADTSTRFRQRYAEAS